MSRSYCGFGNCDDPEHVAVCLACNRGMWKEYRQDHPGPLRRMVKRLFGLDRRFTGWSLPPNMRTESDSPIPDPASVPPEEDS